MSVFRRGCHRSKPQSFGEFLQSRKRKLSRRLSWLEISFKNPSLKLRKKIMMIIPKTQRQFVLSSTTCKSLFNVVGIRSQVLRSEEKVSLLLYILYIAIEICTHLENIRKSKSLIFPMFLGGEMGFRSFQWMATSFPSLVLVAITPTTHIWSEDCHTFGTQGFP